MAYPSLLYPMNKGLQICGQHCREIRAAFSPGNVSNSALLLLFMQLCQQDCQQANKNCVFQRKGSDQKAPLFPFSLVSSPAVKFGFPITFCSRDSGHQDTKSEPPQWGHKQQQKPETLYTFHSIQKLNKTAVD